MKRLGLIVWGAACLVGLTVPGPAQSPGEPGSVAAPTQRSEAKSKKEADEKEPFASATTLAVRFVENRKTAVNLSGTSLSPRVTGKAEVSYKKNDARIKLKLENLDSPQVFGPYYTTYVVWAITPEGQTEFLNELPSGAEVEVNAQSAAQTFGLILTAEPHSAVKVPSQKVIAETTLPKTGASGVQTSQASYQADKGDFYELTDSESAILRADYTTPRLVLGARRSLDIARRAGAKEYATEEWQQAQSMLATLEQIWPRNLKDDTKYSGMARDVMRLGQVARDRAIERENQARIEDERQARLRSLEEARAQAESAKAEAERTKLEAERAKAEAERAKAEAERAARAAEDERLRRENAAREAEAARASAEAARVSAEADRASALKAREEVERAQRQAAQAQQQVAEARRERDAALQKLYVSLSEILDTKRETRGFIINLGDVLFDTAKATLKPVAREKLSKLAGIFMAYPGDLTLEIEGHTDSVGSDELNNRLSQSRAQSVRDYLVQSGVKTDRVKSVQGFGKTKPIATNETAAGRQANRRVEIVIDDNEQASKQQ
ncbi:MAG TPA: OmpA family protein [Blastocatellia bacterium]|nr:OmpA family protein [Blastocatellia bacterium]